MVDVLSSVQYTSSLVKSIVRQFGETIPESTNTLTEPEPSRRALPIIGICPKSVQYNVLYNKIIDFTRYIIRKSMACAYKNVHLYYCKYFSQKATPLKGLPTYLNKLLIER